jgi:tetratricopeptide (TPR) repeat protein
VDVSTGVIRRAYTVEAPDLFALAERVGAQLAGELGQPPPSPRLADVTTTSLVARRFYEEGMRAFYHADRRLALEMFRAALAEDSTFAMAAYAAARTVIFVGDTGALRFAAQAARHAGRTTERERLRIATLWAEMTNDPALVPLADSLASRFPLEPEALLDVGRAHNWAADYPANIAYLRRAIERDSASLAGVAPDTARASPGCTWCDALGDLVAVYLALDSLDAAERTARVFVRRQPRSYNAWSALSEVLESRGREREALDALRRGWGTLAEPPDDRPRTARLHIRAGAFAEADRLLADAAADERAVVRREAAWWRVISLRNQRRLDEALRAARQFAAEAGSPTDPRNRLPEAQVLFEMGRSREAAALFEALTAASLPPSLPDVPNGAPGIAARGLSWNLTHAATAHAAAGDTARLARYVDSVEALGRRSAFGRDRLLHHHLRGLLLMARGDTAAAAAELRRAMTSPTRGYTRTNLELGRALVALGRPREAVAVLRPALHGDLQAGNYYVAHAELHAALARALDAAGEPDSARAHRAWGDGAGGRGRLVAR